MNQYLTAQNVFNFIILGGFVINGIAQWYGGKSTKKSEELLSAERTVKLVNETNAGLELRVTDLTGSVNEMGKLIAVLEAKLKVTEELKDQYYDILRNRDPEFQKFMVNTNTSLLAIEKSLEQLLKSAQQPTVSITNSK